jgi:Cytochrome c oxidase assembly protein CtaG/Cox11
MNMAPIVRHAMIIVLLTAACSRVDSPQEVAIAYGKAIYGYDATAIHRLASAADRRARDEAQVQAQLGAPKGFALELSRELASFIVAMPVSSQIVGDRATVTISFRLPDANAPPLPSLAHEWDETVLDALSARDRRAITRRLDELHRRATLPTVEGKETFELVKESDGWHLVLDWAGGVPVRFAASAAQGIPLELSVTPAEVHVKPGQSFRATLRATNVSTRQVTVRVGHEITPKADAHLLALLQCPLFVPVTLEAGESRTFTSEYLLLKETSETASFGVVYAFAEPATHGATGDGIRGTPAARSAAEN